MPSAGACVGTYVFAGDGSDRDPASCTNGSARASSANGSAQVSSAIGSARVSSANCSVNASVRSLSPGRLGADDGSVCWRNVFSATLLTVMSAPRGSANLDVQELGGRCDYAICGQATISGYPTVCWLGCDLWIYLGVKWCWSEGDERPGSGLVQRYYNAHSWSIGDDGTDMPESACLPACYSILLTDV